MQIRGPKHANTTILCTYLGVHEYLEHIISHQCHGQWRSQFQTLHTHLTHRDMCIRSRNSAYFMISCRIWFHLNSRSALRKLILAGSGCAFLIGSFTYFGDTLRAALFEIQAQTNVQKTLALKHLTSRLLRYSLWGLLLLLLLRLLMGLGAHGSSRRCLAYVFSVLPKQKWLNKCGNT